MVISVSRSSRGFDRLTRVNSSQFVCFFFSFQFHTLTFYSLEIEFWVILLSIRLLYSHLFFCFVIKYDQRDLLRTLKGYIFMILASVYFLS